MRSRVYPANLLRLLFLLHTGTVCAQINLGSFNLNRNPHGDLEVGFGQGGQLFGFGADRGAQFTIGQGTFGAKTGNGVMLGGERIGVDSQLGLQEGQGLNLGSNLAVGNNRAGSTDLFGQLNHFLERLRHTFQGPTPMERPIGLLPTGPTPLGVPAHQPVTAAAPLHTGPDSVSPTLVTESPPVVSSSEWLTSENSESPFESRSREKDRSSTEGRLNSTKPDTIDVPNSGEAGTTKTRSLPLPDGLTHMASRSREFMAT